LIRVFNTSTGAALQELRRGTDTAEIYSLSFHPKSEWLALSSAKGTVHVFSLDAEKMKGAGKAPEAKESTLTAITGKLFGALSWVTSAASSPAKPSEPEKPSNNGQTSSSPTLQGTANDTEPKDGKDKDNKQDARRNPSSSLSLLSDVLPIVGSEWSFAKFTVPGNARTIVCFGEEKHTIVVITLNGMLYKAKFDADKPGICTQIQEVNFLAETFGSKDKDKDKEKDSKDKGS
jgi:WD40 repeat protein